MIKINLGYEIKRLTTSQTILDLNNTLYKDIEDLKNKLFNQPLTDYLNRRKITLKLTFVFKDEIFVEYRKKIYRFRMTEFNL